VRYFIHFEQDEGAGCEDRIGEFLEGDQAALSKAKIIVDELATDYRDGRLRVVDANGRQIGIILLAGGQISPD